MMSDNVYEDDYEDDIDYEDTGRKGGDVGPASYDPRYAPVIRSAPRCSFPTAVRFEPRKVGFISRYHNSNLLCSESPGPAYAYKHQASWRNAPAHSFGGGRRERRQAGGLNESIALEAARGVGPASYQVRHAITLRKAPATSFGTAKRFTRDVNTSDLTIEEDTLMALPIDSKTIHRNHSNRIRRNAPSMSFPRQGAQYQTRTWFLNHNVRGQLSHPATSECAIGPGEYAPNYKYNKRPQGTTFGKSSRFGKPGLRFISNKHCQDSLGAASPGPKYASRLNNTGTSKLNSRASWNWVP